MPPDAPIPDNSTSDEALVFACSCNDDASYGLLYQRYYNHIGYFVKKHSIYQDPSFIDDTRGIIFFKVFSALKQGKFQPQFPGSFKKYLFETALKTTFDENQKRLRIVRPVSEVFTEDELAEPDELRYREPEDTDYEEIEERAKEVMVKLNKKEQRIMQLVAEGVPYAEIAILLHIKSIDTLKNKIYRIKQKLNPREGKVG